MKKSILTTALVLSTLFSQSQINILRYNDNFIYLKNNTALKKGFDKLKYIQLFGKNNISFGGEIREQFQYYKNQNFGDVPHTYKKVNAIQVWQRVMFHTNIELGSKLKIFAQLGSTFRFFNPNPLAPEIDENQLSLHQAFIDYHFPKHWTSRVGRQEISYGNDHVLTFREGPNTRLTFDAAIIKHESQKGKLDFFILTPVTSMPGIFDDKSYEDLIVGMYSSRGIIENTFLIDFYSLSFNSKRRKYDYEAGVESRQSNGIRLYSQNQKFNYELEAAYQYGKFGKLNINAYSISADVNYKLDSKSNFIVGLGNNFSSGDKSKEDNQLNTYNVIFSKPQYGITAPIGSSNIVNINPYFKLNPIKHFNVFASAYLMWRQSNQDGTYSPGAIEIQPNPAILFVSTKKQIGTQIALETSYGMNKHLTFAFDAAYFFAGKYVKETGKGNDITYASLKGGYKF